jgi:gp16 family phage-associated protein
MALTPEQLKAKYRREGKTFKDFATQNSFPYEQVIRVVNGMNKARRGQGHAIAVKLGLKDEVKA